MSFAVVNMVIASLFGPTKMVTKSIGWEKGLNIFSFKPIERRWFYRCLAAHDDRQVVGGNFSVDSIWMYFELFGSYWGLNL